ncbi:hypothetical protein LCGC14_0614510 [marine sediment metagenome]|uniref:Uncharacterized protein n=1 Tax=marine sediment metagenome TaxID=412755 RepID=A0A0F9TSY1_9ZZZZ
MIDDFKRFKIFEDHDELGAKTYALYNDEVFVSSYLPDDEYIKHLLLTGVKIHPGLDCSPKGV